jgi:uncharacterized protein (TIGR03000 family)
MYSLVLMMALTGGGEVPAFGHGCCGGGHHHHGCHGCCGGSSYGCCGGGGYGCCGGSYGGYGCCGGGYSYGCSGGGWSCGGGYGGCSGGYAAPYMAPSGAPPAGGPPAGGPPPAAGTPEKAPPPVEKKDKDEVLVPTPATITVSLPADAKLLVDDTLTASTSATRTFVSPSLAPGQAFHYTLKAEIVRDGQKLSATEVVTVRAGRETRVSLTSAQFADASVASK